MDLNLARDVKDNKNGLYKHTGDKRKTRETVGTQLNEAGDLVTQNMVLNVFFKSVLRARPAFRNCRPQRPGGKSGGRNTYPWWERIRSQNT